MNKAFTLIELLVVVLIIGILSAIALPQYQVAVAKSRYATTKPLVDALSKAEELYYMTNNQYTVDIEALDVDMPAGTDRDSNSSTKYERELSFGYCGIEVTSGEARVYCNANGTGYGRYLLHSSNNPGKQSCKVYGTATDFKHAICKAESGGITPITPATNQYEYLW